MFAGRRYNRITFVFQNQQLAGEVAKRSNAADCKSVALAASKVRVLPSPPLMKKKDSGDARRGGSNSVVESQPSKLLVAGSIPVSRSRIRNQALPDPTRGTEHQAP